MSRLPAGAFDYYVALGKDRSYRGVAEHFGVTKKTVTSRARHEHWQERLATIESTARVRSDARLVETMEEMNARHLQTMRVIQRKCLEALRNYPLNSAMEAVRGLEMSVKHERLIRGEPSERTEVSVERLIQRQYARWMGSATEGGDESDGHEPAENEEDPVDAP